MPLIIINFPIKKSLQGWFGFISSLTTVGFCSNLGAEAAEYYVRSCQDGEVVPVEVVRKILGKLRF